MPTFSPIHAQRPIDMPSFLPQTKAADQRFSMSRQADASALLMSLLLANLSASAFAPRASAPIQIGTIVLVDHAGRLSAAFLVLWPARQADVEAEAEPARRDQRQSERTRTQNHRPDPHRPDPHRPDPTQSAPPPHRPTARVNPYAPEGWSFDRLPHEILGLNAGETDLAKINKAFRAMSLKAHPDKGGSQEAMQALGAARDFMKAQAEQAAGSAAH